MRVVHIDLLLARIPLIKEIKHASYVRHHSDNIVVRTTLDDGTVGYGEGVPRPYVTGEDIDGVFDLLMASDLSSLNSDVSDLPEIVRLIESIPLQKKEHDDRDCYGNAARCGLELSLLDAYTRNLGVPLSKVTACIDGVDSVRKSRESVQYSGAITAGSPKKEFWSALKMKIYGFRDCKIKVGVEGQDDVARMRKFRKILGKRVRVRIDANEAWKPDEVVSQIQQLEKYDIASVEQPVLHEDVACLKNVRAEINTPIMHDESLCSLRDAEKSVADQTCDLFNIRLSKCGGFIRSLRIANYATQESIGYQLGCQVGETGILSAAGRHFATSVDGIRFLEGSYDRHLVVERLSEEDVTFRYGGKAPALQTHGLGITINPESLKRVTRREERICIG